ncbi:MAG: pilus assembly protein [Acidimicrobiales bacterium]|nr:pilus assembly protein [Acidimicrobiales bacterium]
MIMLVFGIIQFGVLFNRQQGLHAAAREGARIASLPNTNQTQIESRVTDALTGVSLSATPTITITPNVTQPCRDRTGLTVVVEVEAASTIEIPMWGTKSFNLSGRGEFRCE